MAFPEVSDSSPVERGRFTLYVTVGNFGDAESAATTLRYYQSTDATISSADTQVGTDAVGAVGAHEISQESVDLTAPSTAGTYYYGACVDAVAGESDTTDNCSGSVTVEVVATTIGSDLVVHGPNRDDSTREPGETFRILVTVQNLGAEWSSATTVRFYRSTDTTITASDTEMGTERVGPLRHLSGSGRTMRYRASLPYKLRSQLRLQSTSRAFSAVFGAMSPSLGRISPLQTPTPASCTTTQRPRVCLSDATQSGGEYTWTTATISSWGTAVGLKNVRGLNSLVPAAQRCN